MQRIIMVMVVRCCYNHCIVNVALDIKRDGTNKERRRKRRERKG